MPVEDIGHWPKNGQDFEGLSEQETNLAGTNSGLTFPSNQEWWIIGRMNFSGNGVTIRAFCINLDSRTDRLSNLEIQGGKLQYKLERFPAVTPLDLAPDQCDYVSGPVAACWQSHVKIFNKIVDEDIDIALISEDDFDLDVLNLDDLASFMLTNRIDVLQLGFLKGTLGRKVDLYGRNLLHIFLHMMKILYKWLPILRNFRDIRILSELRFSNFKYVPYDFRFGTHCYLISLDAAKEIRYLNNPQFLAADDFFVALSKMKHFQIGRLLISRAKQMDSPSSII